MTESQSSQRGGGGSGDEARTVRRGENGDVGAKPGWQTAGAGRQRSMFRLYHSLVT